VDAEFQQLVKKGKKTQQEADAMIHLANEVQYAILTRKLVPGWFDTLLVLARNPNISRHDSHAILLQSNSVSASWGCPSQNIA
jgi:hypothetical protein